MPSVGTVVVNVLMTGVVLGAGGMAIAAVAGEPGADRARVVKVVDGDTIHVDYDGATHKVRLLNIDTPETKHPGKAVECLGPEATEFLEKQLRPGDVVRLEFDEDLHDRYGRELAGVYENGELINAQIARQGLGVPVVFEPNRRFLPEVQAAFNEAKAAERGMFSPDLNCTFAARLDEASQAFEELEAQAASASVKEAESAADEVVAGAAVLMALIDDVKPGSLAAAGMSPEELAKLRDRAVAIKERAEKVPAEVRARVKADKKAEEAARQKAEEAARKKAEAAAKKKAEEEARRQAEEAARIADEQRRAEQAAAEAEAQRQAQEAAAQAEAERRAQQQAPAPAPPPAPQPAPQPANPGLTYTGCRAYVGGPYMDDKGRFYTPIDCTTKQPLVP